MGYIKKVLEKDIVRFVLNYAGDTPSVFDGITYIDCELKVQNLSLISIKGIERGVEYQKVLDMSITVGKLIVSFIKAKILIGLAYLLLSSSLEGVANILLSSLVITILLVKDLLVNVVNNINSNNR